MVPPAHKAVLVSPLSLAAVKKQRGVFSLVSFSQQTDFWTQRFPDWFSFVDQCSTMAQAISDKIKNAGKEEAIADARRRLTILLEKS